MFKRFSRTLGAAPTTSAHLGYFINGTVNALPASGGIIASITLPVTGNYIVSIALNFGNASSTNSLYIQLNTASGTFYGGSPLIVGGGFISLNTTLIFVNTGSTVYNIVLSYNGTPNLQDSNFITAIRIA